MMSAGHPSLLMIAYEFPPCQSAGVQRTLKFAQHLPSHGWSPVVLTTVAGAYRRIDDSVSPPAGVEVRRAHSLDASRHLAIRGRYLQLTATPDRYSSWFPFAVRAGRSAIRERRPAAIYSTFPVFTAHLVARSLARRSGLPWIADFRDPAPEHYEPGHRPGRLARSIDRTTVQEASLLVFATGRMRARYLERYPECDPRKAIVIENGFDEDRMSALTSAGRERGETFDILHSGAIYPQGRDITALLEALAKGPSHTPDGRLIRLHLRGAQMPSPGESPIPAMLDRLNLAERVHFLPPCSYEAALEEMGQSDALLLLQGPLFDLQIPGKAYEYAATDRPILALGGPNGATAALMRETEGTAVGDSDDADSIARALTELTSLAPRRRDSTKLSRKERTAELATALDAFRPAAAR